MIERCEMISKRKGSFHYYFFKHKQNKTTEKAIEEYLQELKEKEVLKDGRKLKSKQLRE